MTLALALKRIRQLTEVDLQNKTIFELFTSAAEELGELGCELKIAHETYGATYKEPGEGPKAEAVDLAICALAVFYGEGGNDDELVEILHHKLDKWSETGKRLNMGGGRK